MNGMKISDKKDFNKDTKNLEASHSKSLILSRYLTTNNNNNQMKSNNGNINLLQKYNIQNEQIQKLKNELINKNKEIKELKLMISNKDINFIKEKNNLINIYNRNKYNLEESRNEINFELKSKTNQLINLNKLNDFHINKLNDKKIALSKLENEHNIIKNNYDLLKNQSEINNQKYINEIDILQNRINYLNKSIEQKNFSIDNLIKENKILKQKINSIKYDYNIIYEDFETNKMKIKKNNMIINKKDTENKKLEIEYESIINDYKYKEQNYLLEIKNLKNRIYDEENKSHNLNYEIKKQNEANQKLMLNTQNIIEENFIIKNKCNKLEKTIKNTEEKENEKIDILKDNYFKYFKLNAEDEKNFLLKENENLMISNEELIKEKKNILVDLQDKNIDIHRYGKELENIDEKIENIKNKMREPNTLSFLSPGFQVYLFQRINKEINKTENIYLYLTSSLMEIENLINGLKDKESIINRQNKEILNLKSEIENLKQNENKLKSFYSNNQKSTFEIEYNYNKINRLLNQEMNNNDKYIEQLNHNEYIISEACAKNENLETIISFFINAINGIREIVFNLSESCQNNCTFYLIQELFDDINKLIDYNNNNFMNNKIIGEEIEKIKTRIFNLINSINEQITKEKISKKELQYKILMSN